MPQLKPGQVLGSWTAESFLDEGGNGEVWQVAGPDHPKAALKLLKTNKIESVAYQRFQKEISALRSLHSAPGILPILEANLPDKPAKGNRAWYVMPFATSLARELEGTDVRQAVLAVAMVAETLADLHAKHVRHRDIKPANLLWLHGRPQVADFGLVSLPDQESVEDPGRVPGSMGYISDEMLSDHETADAAAADVFALAKVLWMLLVPGHQFPPQGPLRADGGPSSLVRNLTVPTADTLDRIIEAATRPERTRISMAQLAQELRTWLALPPVPALPTSLSERLAAARASMAGVIVERDAEAVRARDIAAAKKTLVATASSVTEAIKSIDPTGAVVGPGAIPKELRGTIEETNGLGTRAFGPAFHHGVRISREHDFVDPEHLVVAFAMQFDDEGMATIAGCGFVGEVRTLGGGKEFVWFPRREVPLGASLDAAIAAVVSDALGELELLVGEFG